MFERYTEKARRTIFFARYEASQYGSPYIETEHLLLGLLREDHAFARMFLGPTMSLEQVRGEIEKHIVVREPIPTSVEVPLAADCKRILHMAAEESERLGHKHIGTQHILVGMLNFEGSLAARLLHERGVKASHVRARLAEATKPATFPVKERRDEEGALTLDSFLAGLKWNKAGELIEFFAQNARLIDVFGRHWNREEIAKNFESLFAPYAKKNAAPLVEEIFADEMGFLVATVLWKNAVLASMERIWMHRMTFVLILEVGRWRILVIQATALQPRQLLRRTCLQLAFFHTGFVLSRLLLRLGAREVLFDSRTCKPRANPDSLRETPLSRLWYPI